MKKKKKKKTEIKNHTTNEQLLRQTRASKHVAQTKLNDGRATQNTMKMN